MPSARITKRLVDAMTAGNLFWDTEVRGFGVRYQKDRPIYVLKVQVKGRSRWFSIGPHGAPWTPETARYEAQRLIGEVKSGTNLVAIREGRTTAATISELCDRYIDEYAVSHKKPSSVSDDRRNIHNHIKPMLGRLTVDDLTRDDIERFKRAVLEGKSFSGAPRKPPKGRLGPQLKGGPYVANRTVALLSKMLNLAELWGWRAEHSNPCRLVKKFAERRVQRFLTDNEIERLGLALDTHETSHPSDAYAVAAIRLLLLTGARVSEILSLQWSFVDLQRQMLMLPDSKTGAKTIHLNDQAVALFRGLPQRPDNVYVIAGSRLGMPLVNLKKPWQKIRKEAGLADVRLHDLRHSFASIAAANGASLLMIGKLLGHASPLTTQRYAHLVADPLKEIAQGVGASIGKVMKPSPGTPDQEV